MFGRYEALHPKMSFTEFVGWLVSPEGNDDGADPHFLSQHYFLLDYKGDPAVDFVGKVETIGEDLPELQAILGLDIEAMPHLNANRTQEREPFDTSRRWLEILDDHSKRLLAARYDADFELLGYPRLPYKAVPQFVRKPDTTHLAAARGRRWKRELREPLRRCRVLVNRALAPLGIEVRRKPRPVNAPR